MITVWQLAWTFFFGTHVSGLRIAALSHSQYRVSVYTCIYTFLKRKISRFNFRSYVLNLVKINISFFLSKVESLGTDLSITRA